MKLNYGLTGIVTMKKFVHAFIESKENLCVKHPQEASSPNQGAQGCIQSALESPQWQRPHQISSRLFQPMFPHIPIQEQCCKWPHLGYHVQFWAKQY